MTYIRFFFVLYWFAPFPCPLKILDARLYNFIQNGKPGTLISLPRITPDFVVLEICVFDNFISVDELFAKALQRNLWFW